MGLVVAIPADHVPGRGFDPCLLLAILDVAAAKQKGSRPIMASRLRLGGRLLLLSCDM